MSEILTIWGAFPFDDDPDEDIDDDDRAFRCTHGLNERGEFDHWQPEEHKHG